MNSIMWKEKTFKAFDYETTGLNPWNGCNIFAFSLTDWDGTTKVYRLDGDDKFDNWQILFDFFADTSIIKIAQNFKFELHFTKKHKIKIPSGTIFHDTMLMSSMLNNLEPAHSLPYLFNSYIGNQEIIDRMNYIDKVVETQAKIRGGYQFVDKEIMHEYQSNDTIRTMLLFRMYYPLLQQDSKLYQIYQKEIDLAFVTQRMEEFGLLISPKNIKVIKSNLTQELDKIQNESWNIFNQFTNFNSDDEIRRILYDRYEVPVTRLTEKTNVPSVDKDILLDLHNNKPEFRSICETILKYRSYTKGIAMFDGYLKSARADNIINHNIMTNRAKTGRQGANNPNTQNIQKSGGQKNMFPVPARKVFIARPDSMLLFVDYAGIEMRLIIDAVNQENMIERMLAGEDMHCIAAEHWYGKWFTDRDICLLEYLPHKIDLYKQYKKALKKCFQNPIEVEKVKNFFFAKAWSLLRSAAKNGQFGLAYGASLEEIANTVLMPVDIVEPGYNRYCDEFPKIKSFVKNTLTFVKKHGYVVTAHGRKLYIDKKKLFAGANAQTQGTAAEILKFAEIEVDKWLIKNFPDIRLLLPIHDELMIHCPNKYESALPEILPEINKIMCDMPKIKIPLAVEWKVTHTNWDEATEYKLT